MFTRSGVRVAFASLAATGTTLMFCSAVVLSTTACGIRVSSTDFPVFRLAEPDAGRQARGRGSPGKDAGQLAGPKMEEAGKP
jgi:hypothetical protein